MIMKVFRPWAFQGSLKRRNYFEGWYFKHVSADRKRVWSFIPGISLSKINSHAFIQVLNGRTGKSYVFEYGVDEFSACSKNLDLHLGSSSFNPGGIKLDLNNGSAKISGSIEYSGLEPYPSSIINPGIMGWYSFVPFMECKHGVVSMHHSLHGGIHVGDSYLDFEDGTGYIEKDWGKSFPSAWIWFQTNHFEEPGTSLTASVAIISWVRRSFPGFIVGLWHGGTLYRFATYTGARIEQLEISDEAVTWIIRDRHHRLEMCALRSAGGLLRAPTPVDMGRRIAETLNARVEMALYSLEDDYPRRLFQGTGRHAGLEAVGDLARLRAMWVSQAEAPG